MCVYVTLMDETLTDVHIFLPCFLKIYNNPAVCVNYKMQNYTHLPIYQKGNVCSMLVFQHVHMKAEIST